MIRIRAAVASLCILFFVFPLFAASREPVHAPHAMVSSARPIASKIGAEVMARGGNAVDAAVAVALALAVIWPEAGNLGGGGFMLVRVNGKADFIDYRETAPAAATRDMYLDANGNVVENLSTLGYKGVGVPGTIAGLALAHERYGRLKWRDLVQPAYELALHGFEVDWYFTDSIHEDEKRLAQFPESRRIFLRNGRNYTEGERFIQPELAATLKRLRDQGPREFYEGRTAKLLVDDIQRNGGILTARDLRDYRAVVRQPLTGSYRGFEIITSPPPSSGGIALLEMLNVLERHDVASLGNDSAAEIHLLAETMRRAFADRSELLGDPDFVKVPVARLTDKNYAAKLDATIDLQHASRSAGIKPGNGIIEPVHTTHFTIVDRDGNVVTNTYTLNDSFGSAATVAGTGILLNDEMDDFTSKPGIPNLYGLIQGELNAINPRKRPLSSMVPTIVLQEGKVWFALGASGGPRIISAVLQTIVNIVDYRMDIQEAIDVPRVHQQWMPDEIRIEPRGMNADTRSILEQRGHIFIKKPGFVAIVHAVMIDPKSGERLGAADPRQGGGAAGK